MNPKSTNAVSLADALRSAAAAEAAIACRVVDSDADAGSKIHDVRRSCKRMRGCLRLLEPALERHYADENRAFRDIGRGLSGLRDDAVVLTTFERFVESAPGADVERELPALRAMLASSPARGPLEVGAEEPVLHAARNALAEARHRIGGWSLEEMSSEALDGAVQRTYERARARHLALRHSRSDAAFHEWRKECKYHWIQLGALRDILGLAMTEREAQAHELSETLGAAHDLAVLLERLATLERAPASALAFAVRVATRKRVELEDHALALGSALFADERFQGVQA